MKWYIKVLNQYFDFKGRARRKEFWMFFLFNSIFLIIATILDNVLGILVINFTKKSFGPLYLIYYLVTLIPYLAVIVRRLHDVGKSGWFLLLPFIFFILGFLFKIYLIDIIAVIIFVIAVILYIWIWYLLLKNSQPGTNKWGPNPKEITELETNS